MSMIENMAKEMQAHRNEDKMEMDQIKGVSTNVPTDNKFEIYLMDNTEKKISVRCQYLDMSSMEEICNLPFFFLVT
jgi:hypothetical protein